MKDQPFLFTKEQIEILKDVFPSLLPNIDYLIDKDGEDGSLFLDIIYNKFKDSLPSKETISFDDLTCFFDNVMKKREEEKKQCKPVNIDEVIKKAENDPNFGTLSIEETLNKEKNFKIHLNKLRGIIKTKSSMSVGDIHISGSKYWKVKFCLPGVQKCRLSLSCHTKNNKNYLKLSYDEYDGLDDIREAEVIYTPFQHEIEVPTNIDINTISSEYFNGILIVTGDIKETETVYIEIPIK